MMRAVEGDELYEAMLADIAAARTCILMESYIFAADEIGWRFARALAERAVAGCVCSTAGAGEIHCVTTGATTASCW